MEKKVYDLFPYEAWGIDCGPKRILYLLVVDEEEYDFFRHEGKEMDRGRKRICPCTKKANITADCGKHGCARSVSNIFLWAFLLFTVLFYTCKCQAIPGQALRFPGG